MRLLLQNYCICSPAEQSPKCKQLSSRELLNSSLQGLIDEINAKRKRDSSLLSGKEAFETHIIIWCPCFTVTFITRLQEGTGPAM